MKLAKGLKVAALVPLGLATAVLLLFGVGEMASGDWSGVGHLIPAILIGLLMWLGWKRPLWSGILLLILGILARFFFADALRGPGALWPFLIFIAPLLFSGLLLLYTFWLERGKTANNP